MKQNWTHTTRTINITEEVTYDYLSKRDIVTRPAETKTVDNYEIEFGHLDIVITGTPGDWTAEITDNTTGRPSSIMCDGFVTFEDAETWVIRSLYSSLSSAYYALSIIKEGWKV